MDNDTDNPFQSRINEVFQAQQKHALSLRRESLWARVRKLKALKQWIDSNAYHIQKAIYADFKKPAHEVDMSDIYPVLTELKDAIVHLKEWAKDKKVDSSFAYLSTTSYVRYEPKGVCLIIAPWNFPFNLTIGPLVSAIAAGNTAMIKPSEMTPHTSDLIDKMIGEVFKEEDVAVFTGEVEVSKALLELPFDHIFFTGSPQVGKVVMRAASQHLTSVTLELGGKSPTVIDANANIKDTATKIAWGKLMNNGQTCVAPDYAIVHNSVKEDFVEAIKKQCQALFDSENKGFEHSNDYARIINDRHLKRLKGLIDRAVSDGAKLEFGGNWNEIENFLEPTILSDVPTSSDIMQEEIFGPVLPIITFDTFDDVIQTINERPKPLALYYFGKSSKRRKRLILETSSGTVCVNDCVLQFGHPNLPFGGVNNSGIGKAHGKYGFLAFSNERAVLKQKIGSTTTKLIYPPYNKRVKFILSLLKKFF